MAGLTPFQFTSKRQQDLTLGSAFGLSVGGNIGQMLKSTFSWYEMWINPEKVNISTIYKQKRQHTARSIVTYHFRKDALSLSVSGQCGWVMIQSKSKDVSVRIKSPTGSELVHSLYWQHGKGYFDKRRWSIETEGPPKNLVSDNTDNSPRVFLKRLKNIADEPMYFIDLNGIEHYNTKFIKMYTKQYPAGVVCEGYYTKFDVPESADDVQTISYNFEFIIENMTSISFIEKRLGMWSGFGEAKRAANVIRGLS